MRKYVSLILVIALSLWAICSGFSRAEAGEVNTPTDLPSVQVETPFETPTDLVAFGDVNGDSTINAKDALKTLKMAVAKYPFTPHEKMIADVTRDTIIGAQDALEMLKYAVKKPNAIQPMEMKLQTIYGDTYTANTPYATAWKTQLATAELSYGIKTQVEGVDPFTAVDTFVKAVMAGRVETDLMEVSLHSARQLAKKKVAANLSESETLRWYRFQNVGTKSFAFGEKRYGVSLEGACGGVTGILYNKDLIGRYAPKVDIQDLTTKKEWTFDAFRSLAKQCTLDTDEDGKTDIYGVTSNNNFLGMATAANTGGYALMKNNRVEESFCNSMGVAAIQWCKDLYKTDKSWRYQGDLKDAVDVFAQGEAAMLATYAFMAEEVAKTADFEMGFVPMPMGPAQTDYITSVYDARVYVVPKTNIKRLSQVGIWLNGIADVSDALLKVNLERLAESGVDPQGCENYERALGSATPDFFTGVFSSPINTAVENLITYTPEELARVHNAAQQELDEFYNPLY